MHLHTFFKKRPARAALLGSLLECYDNALYGFMAPILVGVFLPKVDPLDAFIWAYAIYPLKILFKPFGAAFMGYIGDNYGRKNALSISIAGMAIVVGCVGLLPTYEKIGLWAAVCMAASRMLQAFFAAGEYNGAAIFALEHEGKKPGKMSGLYCASCVIGIIAASGMAALVASCDAVSWRVPYILAFLTGIYGWFLRRKTAESPEFSAQSTQSLRENRFRNSLRGQGRLILSAMGAAACFASLCYLSSSFLVAYLPLATEFSKATVLQLNTVGLIAYMLALYGSGCLADKYGISRTMSTSALLAAALALPLWKLINYESFIALVVFKLSMSILAGAFIGPFHAWIQQLFAVRYRYTLVSVAYSIGAQLGALTPLIGFTLWKYTQWPAAPGLLLLGFSLMGFVSVYVARKGLNTAQSGLGL